MLEVERFEKIMEYLREKKDGTGKCSCKTLIR